MKQNQYISRYNAGDTQFKRTDPNRYASWVDHNDSDHLSKGVALAWVSACLLAIALIVYFSPIIDNWRF